MDLLLLHPKPPPTRGPVKRAAPPVTSASRLRAENAGNRSPTVSFGQARGPIPSARPRSLAAHARRHLDTRRLPARRPGGARPRARNLRADGRRARPARLLRPAGGAPLPRRRAAAARPLPARRHGGRVRADPRRGRAGPPDLRPRRLRRRRHRRHHARRPPPARARRRRRLAPAEPLRRGLRRPQRDARPARRRGLRARPHRRLRDHGRRRGGRGEGARSRRHRHRPSPAGRDAARLPDRRHPPVRVPVPRALRHRRRLQARARRCSASSPRFRGATSTSSRSRRSPTSSRSSTRTGRSRSPGCAPSRAPRSPGCARSCRAPASIRPLSTPAPSGSGSRPA